MAKKRTPEKSVLPVHTIVDVLDFTTRHPRQAERDAEIVRLHEAPKRWSYGQIAKHLSAKYGKEITRDAVIKAYQRAKKPEPSPCAVTTVVFDHDAGTFSLLPPSLTTALEFRVDDVAHTVSITRRPPS
jgi:hypothetical protein